MKKDTLEAFLDQKFSKNTSTFKDLYCFFAEKFSEEKGINRVDPYIYKKSLIDRRTFNKFANDWDDEYHFCRDNAIKICLALELNLEDTLLLLGSTGYGIGENSKRDLILRYCITHQIYDVLKVNDILFENEQALLLQPME